ncbi:MAG: hypothetical protein WCF68_15790 [Terriglobales bacterium]
MKIANRIIGLTILVMAQLATAQQQQQPLSLGENTKLNAGGLFDFGYQGSYGDGVQSDHGLEFAFDSRVSGYYYNPNFLSFNITPYYDQSRDDSDSQSLTGSSGIVGSANFFSGSKFPGSVSFDYTRNTTSEVGLAGSSAGSPPNVTNQPNIATVGKGHGFGISWSALVPDWPTLSVGYSQGSGSGTLFGTNQDSDSSTRMFNVHSGYQFRGWGLNAFFNHNSMSSEYPQFLGGEGSSSHSSDNDFGYGTHHRLPEHGYFSINYNRAAQTSVFTEDEPQNGNSGGTESYTDTTESATASFHPTMKFSWNLNENYTSNLSGYLAQNLSGNGTPVAGIDLGPTPYSLTFAGQANYNFTTYLIGSAQATYYDQYYFGKSYAGEFVSGNVSYGKKLFDTFTFSASVIDNTSDFGNNSLGFGGVVNFFRRFKGWWTSGTFSYGQNVQTILATYTTSGYGYSANVRHSLPGGMAWISSFTGSHSGLTNDPGSSSSSESYSTSLSMRRVQASTYFSTSHGVSVLGAAGIISPTPTPGLTDFYLFNGSSYGGSLSGSPLRRLSLSASYSRAISNTFAATNSRNNLEIYNAQMQYRLRKIGLLSGYTRYTQGISAIGAPATSTSFYVGISRWFDFF